MFIIGTGSIFALAPPIYLYRGISSCSAAALATARDTPRIAFAPSLALLGVPSVSYTHLDVYKRQVGTASACITDAGEAEDLIKDIVEKVEELKK